MGTPKTWARRASQGVAGLAWWLSAGNGHALADHNAVYMAAHAAAYPELMSCYPSRRPKPQSLLVGLCPEAMRTYSCR